MTTKLIRYWRRGWRIGTVISKGHKWVTIRTRKADGSSGKYKILRSHEAAEIQELPVPAV